LSTARDELLTRHAGFTGGVVVVLADGQSWTLPVPAQNAQHDPELEGLLRCIAGAEDRPEQLRGELALTILLLSRNYALRPEEFNALLSFPHDDPRLAVLQERVHALAVEAIGRLASDGGPGRSGRSDDRPENGFAARWFRRWRLWTS
jgi:hypothetical protein